MQRRKVSEVIHKLEKLMVKTIMNMLAIFVLIPGIALISFLRSAPMTHGLSRYLSANIVQCSKKTSSGYSSVYQSPSPSLMEQHQPAELTCHNQQQTCSINLQTGRLIVLKQDRRIEC